MLHVHETPCCMFVCVHRFGKSVEEGCFLAPLPSAECQLLVAFWPPALSHSTGACAQRPRGERRAALSTSRGTPCCQRRRVTAGRQRPSTTSCSSALSVCQGPAHSSSRRRQGDSTHRTIAHQRVPPHSTQRSTQHTLAVRRISMHASQFPSAATKMAKSALAMCISSSVTDPSSGWHADGSLVCAYSPLVSRSIHPPHALSSSVNCSATTNFPREH